MLKMAAVPATKTEVSISMRVNRWSVLDKILFFMFAPCYNYFLWSGHDITVLWKSFIIFINY